jgi:hypothetical protein
MCKYNRPLNSLGDARNSTQKCGPQTHFDLNWKFQSCYRTPKTLIRKNSILQFQPNSSSTTTLSILTKFNIFELLKL